VYVLRTSQKDGSNAEVHWDYEVSLIKGCLERLDD